MRIRNARTLVFLFSIALVSIFLFQNCGSSNSAPSAPGSTSTATNIETACPSANSLPQGLTLSSLDPSMTSTIGAHGGLYSQYLQKNSGLAVSSQDCSNQFQAADGNSIGILVKAPALKNNQVYNVPDYPMASGQTVLNYLSSAISYATGSNPTATVYGSIVFPKAIYEVEDFSGCDDARGANGYNHWEIDNVSDLTVDGQGSTLNFNGLCQGLQFNWVQRVIFKNFTLQWPNVQLAALGTIQSVNPSGANPTMNVLVNSKYPVSRSTIIESITSWDPVNNWWSLQYPADDEGMDQAHTNYLGNQTIQFGMFTAGFHVGETVLLRYFAGEAPALVVNASEDVALENINVYNSTGSAFQFGLGRGFLLANSQVAPMPGALISVAGDAIHMAGDKGDIVIAGNTISGQGDDGLNLNATMWCNSTASGTNAQPCNTSLGGSSATTASSLPIYSWWENIWSAGDVLGFFNSNFLLSGYSSVKTTSQNPNVSTTLQFNHASPSSAQFLADLTYGGSRYIIQNNSFLHNRGRGVILQTSNGIVSGNNFDGQTMHAIYVMASPFWGEGPGAQNLIVSNNTVAHVGNYVQQPAPFSSVLGAVVVATEDTSANTIAANVPLHQNIIFSGNTVENTPGPAFFISTANNVILSNNQITNTNKSTATPITYGSGSHPANSAGSVVVTDVTNVFFKGNQITGSSGAISVDTSSTSGITGN